MKTCQVGDAIVEENNKILIDQKKCISCGECLKTCPVKGAIKGIHIATYRRTERDYKPGSGHIRS